MTTELLDTRTPTLDDLVNRLQDGDLDCWGELISRFQPLVNSLTRRYRLTSADASDVSQTVWMRLFTHIHRLRDPRALPGWIATTTSRACMDVLNLERRTIALDPHLGYDSRQAGIDRLWASKPSEPRPDEIVIEATAQSELRGALMRGLADLTRTQRDLLLLLLSDPPLSYQEIARRLDIPIGSIGPTRARAMARLRLNTRLRALAAQSLDHPEVDNVRCLHTSRALRRAA